MLAREGYFDLNILSPDARVLVVRISADALRQIGSAPKTAAAWSMSRADGWTA